MRVALHINPEKFSELLGIWVAPTQLSGRPVCFYPASTPASVVEVGEGWMHSRNGMSWDEKCEYLASRSPYSAYWGYNDVEEADDLEALFVQLAADVVASAVAHHGVNSEGWTSKMLSDEEELELLGLSDPMSVVKAIAGPTEAFQPKRKAQRLSSLLAYFADGDRLLVVARRTKNAANADLALAHGLAYREDRDLWLALPRESAGATLARAPWIAPPMRIWTYGDADIAEEVLRAPIEVVRSYKDVFTTSFAELGDRERWVKPLTEWAESMPGLESAHRSQYLAWHCAGRGVLTIKRTSKGLAVIGGVNATNPTPNRKPAKVTLDGPIAAADAHRVIAAASLAAVDRLDGTDDDHQEHRLQAGLTAKDLGLLSIIREFPAWRPSGGRGFIDFLGVDGNGRVHVVETKIGPDDLLVLQGLDYWIWANAHSAEIRDHFQLSHDPKFVIDFVVSPKPDATDALSVYTAAQAEALAGSIIWRFHDVSGWRDGKPPQALSQYTVLHGVRRAGDVPARWAKRLDTHLGVHGRDQGWKLNRARRFTDAHDGLVVSAHGAYETLKEQGVLHHAVAHPRSSQAFALNLFAPLDDQGLRELWSARFHEYLVEVEPPEFEYTDPADTLGEATHASPHATQVDVLLRGRDETGATHIALIEVKLSEEDFGACSAYTSESNERRGVCRQPGPFGGDPIACFQLSNHDREQRRRYDKFLPPFSGRQSGTGCCFRNGANQVMRNVALAQVLLERHDAETVTVALAAPHDHAYIWRRWIEAKELFEPSNKLRFIDLPAEAVLQFQSVAIAEQLAARYLLDPTAAQKRAKVAEVQHELDQRFPKGARYLAFEPPREVSHWVYDPRPLITDINEEDHPVITVHGYIAGPMEFPVAMDQIVAVATNGDGTLELQHGPHRRVLTNDLTDVDPEWIEQRRNVRAPIDFAP